jgi:hypothetical protein
MNGQKIFRGVDMGSDGVYHQNESILFPPTVITKHGPVLPLAELVELAMSKIVIVGKNPQAEINVSTTIDAISKVLRKSLAFWMKRAVLNERERIRLALERHGLKEAQHAMMDGADG